MPTKKFYWPKFTEKISPTWIYVLGSAGTGAFFAGSSLFYDQLDSTIHLPGRISSIFDTSGDYVEFDYFYNTGDNFTILGSAINSSAIVFNTGQVSVLNDGGTGTLNLTNALSTGDWNTVLLTGDGSNINVYIDDVLQAGSISVRSVDVDIIGKNQDAYQDVRAMDFTPANSDYLYNTPNIQIYGDPTGFWRAGSFYLDNSGTFTIYDNMTNYSGWRIEVKESGSQELLQFTVGNGSGSSAIVGNQEVYVGSWNHFYVHLEQVASFDDNDTVITGFCQNTDDFYVGATDGTSQYFDGKLDGLYGGTGQLLAGQQGWLFDGGSGRAVDEITANSPLPSGLLDFGYGLYQTNTGVKADNFGNNDLTVSSDAAGSITYPLSLKSSFLNEDKFSGYLRNLKIRNSSFTFIYNLYTNTADDGSGNNDGVASDVSFVSVDPTGL